MQAARALRAHRYRPDCPPWGTGMMSPNDAERRVGPLPGWERTHPWSGYGIRVYRRVTDWRAMASSSLVGRTVITTEDSGVEIVIGSETRASLAAASMRTPR